MSHPIDTHVGARLALRRQLLGMTQEGLAKAIGVSFQQVQKYERGLNRLSASRLHLCAAALHVPVAFFFEDLPEDAAPPAPIAPTGFGTDELALLHAFRRLQPDQRDAFRAAIVSTARVSGGGHLPAPAQAAE